MVSASDLKVYKTTNNLGGAITGTQINSATPNNLFTNVSKSELTPGEDYYACVYFKNTHATEKMDNFKLWLSDKSFPHDTEIKWAFDPIVVSFDGVNDFIDCTNDATLWSQTLTKFSFSFWIWPTAGWDANDRLVVGHGGASNQAFRCFIDTAVTGRIRFQIKNAAGSTLTATNDTLTLNVWNHVVCSYDNTLGSDNVRIYVNGVGGTHANLTETINLSATLILGDSSNDFKGYMKDFQWWTENAKSSTGAGEVYNGTHDVDPDYWLVLNEGTGNPVDKISHTKVGTLTNGASWLVTQTIANKYTPPISASWQSLAAQPSKPNVGQLSPSETFAIWLWYHVSPEADARLDDSELFSFNFDIPQGGTGTPGGGDSGGSGGNPPPVNADYKIAVAGDWGCENETDDVIDLIMNNDYDALVGVGDNAYASASCWTSRFDNVRDAMVFHSAYGNHEYSESGGTSPYKTFFGDNKTYYTFKFQNILFAIFDSNIDFTSGSAQHTAMTNAINASLTDNTITWRIGVLHHPMFGADSDHSYNDNNFDQEWQRYLQNNKFSFVLAGHNHNWQRTKQVTYNSGNPESPTVVASSSPFSRNTVGIIHVITGAGGHDSGSSLYALGSQPSFQAYQNRTHNGIWEMVASNNGQTLDCAFVETGGSKFDKFVINA